MRLTLLRVAVSATTATAGYVSYKLKEGRDWLDEKLEILNNLKVPFIKANTRTPLDINDDMDSASTNTLKNNQQKQLNQMQENHTPKEQQDKEFSAFVKKMVEIDDLLRSGGGSFGDSTIELPRIVVIGSQSAGKSSVLERIVGHSFLPKGSNMVTRRPLLLRLVNDPSANQDYAVFPGNIRIDDFKVVQDRLYELNMAVKEHEWVSADPVELYIHSKQLPDLTLIDLPGYIAVNSKRQPAELREKIRDLCAGFLDAPNLILAVSAADVDLANSEALQAARHHDPRGERTIGVLTKIDLVDSGKLRSLLANDDYHLTLGYVPVSCADGTGFKELLQRVTGCLEDNLRSASRSILTRVNEQLADVRHELKAKFNDRSMSPDAYLSEVVGLLRDAVEQVMRDHYSRSSVKQLVQTELFDKHVIESLLLHGDDQSADGLARAGWGRRVASLVGDRLQRELKETIVTVLKHHPSASEDLLTTCESQLRHRVMAAADQIENALKPFKHQLDDDYTKAEWRHALNGLNRLLDEQVKEEQRRSDQLKREIGGEDRIKRLMEACASKLLDARKCKLADDLITSFRIFQSLKKLQDTVKSDCRHNTTCHQVYLYLMSTRLAYLSSLYAQDELACRLRISEMLLNRYRSDPRELLRENEQAHRAYLLEERVGLLERVREHLIKIL